MGETVIPLTMTSLTSRRALAVSVRSIPSIFLEYAIFPRSAGLSAGETSRSLLVLHFLLHPSVC